MELRKEEYALRWEFITAAYSENQAAMDNARESIKTVRSQLLQRQKAVGKEPEKNGKNGGKK